MRIPEPLISKSGLTRTATRGRIPSRCPISTSRRASVLGLHLHRHPGGHRLTQLGGRLSRARKADPVRRHRGVQGGPELEGGGDVEAVDQTAEMVDHGGHRIGLDRVAEVDAGRQGSPQPGDPAGQQAPVVGEEWRLADPLGENIHRNPAHAEAAGPGGECGHRAVLRHVVSSSRSSVRSNLPLGDRGISGLTSTRCGSM